jgi:hypothetical protein
MPSSSVQRRQQISRAPWELLARPCITRAFEGNAAKSLQEAAALDELIDVMLSAKSQQEVGRGRRIAAVQLLQHCARNLPRALPSSLQVQPSHTAAPGA